MKRDKEEDDSEIKKKVLCTVNLLSSYSYPVLFSVEQFDTSTFFLSALHLKKRLVCSKQDKQRKQIKQDKNVLDREMTATTGFWTFR